MDIRLEPKKLAEVDSDALVIVGFEGCAARSCRGRSDERVVRFRRVLRESPRDRDPASSRWPEGQAPGAGRRRKARQVRCGRTSETYRRRGPRAEEQGHPQHHAGLWMRLGAPTISWPLRWKARYWRIWKTTAIRPIRRRTKSRWIHSRFWAGRKRRWTAGASWRKRKTSAAIWPTNPPMS